MTDPQVAADVQYRAAMILAGEHIDPEDRRAALPPMQARP